MDFPTLEDLTIPAPPLGPADWNDDGVLMLPGFFSAEQMRPYREEWIGAHWPEMHDWEDLSGEQVGGWPDATPYMRFPELRRLVCNRELSTAIGGLIHEIPGVHLNLTGWVTTERDWHQDTYLNPPHVGDQYAAIWVALDDIDADSGPFQFVPGSHRWPVVTQLRIGQYLNINDPQWPKRSEAFLTPLFEREIKERDAEVVSYLPKRGDVLVWHGRLLHRGSRARVHGSIRPALIAHYSGIDHRRDMPTAMRHEDAGGWYFPLGGRQPVR